MYGIYVTILIRYQIHIVPISNEMYVVEAVQHSMPIMRTRRSARRSARRSGQEKVQQKGPAAGGLLCSGQLSEVLADGGVIRQSCKMGNPLP